MGASRPRNSTRARKAHPPKKPRCKPAHRKSSKPRMGAAGWPYVSPTQAVRELRAIRNKLRLIISSVIVVEHALLHQNVELDGDTARILRIHVGDALQGEIEQIDGLLGENDEDEDGGAS
jgi:hypothetical protein